MRRIKGPEDITYCSTKCMNQNCRRNLQFYKPPTKYYSCSKFDETNNDELHLKCKNKYIK